MASSAFMFLRATYWRWCETIYVSCPSLKKAPRVLGVGDIHLENFGTWRDAEGRLVWGVNDVDEAAVLPCTTDLVRLVTSARLADLEVHDDDAASNVLSGYREQLAIGPRPFVLAEQQEHLWKLARDHSDHPERWWQERKQPDPLPAHIPLGNVKELLRGD